MRRRAALELAAVAVATALFLLLVRRRPVVVDAGLALLALALVVLSASETRRRFWGEPAEPLWARRRRAWRDVTVGTAAVAALFAAAGALATWWMSGEPDQMPARLLRPTLPLALVLFVPWAGLQQTLFQFYLLGRLRALCPGARPGALAALAGVLFGLVHLPALDVAAVTVVGGALWARFYLRDRLLAPLAVSHAVLGATYYYWVRGEDLLARWTATLTAG
ncbi:MAG TPA: CPBP family glutamic-type intramembrane protease [Candidatus Binatia bacterium]|nr:CPBP family glutamic-type intramembrane protease [Candidatus Binatia bacterium]